MLMTRRSSPLMLCVAVACTSWHLETVSPQELITVRQPTAVRVTLLGGEQVVVRKPRLSADTLLGTDVTGERKGLMAGTLLARDGPDTAIALPITVVRGIATRKASAGKTALFLGGVFAITAAAGAAMGCMSMSCP